MKARRDAVGTVENEYGSEKHENETRRPLYPETESGSTKHENWTRCPQNRQKRVRVHQT
jgi:hypothetical protein